MLMFIDYQIDLTGGRLLQVFGEEQWLFRWDRSFAQWGIFTAAFGPIRLALTWPVEMTYLLERSQPR